MCEISPQMFIICSSYNYRAINHNDHNVRIHNVVISKSEPSMLKILLLIPSRHSSTSQKNTHALFFFYSHIITYYSHIIFCINVSGTLLLTSGETRT